MVMLFFGHYVHAQMPTNGDYSNWEWEDQSQPNWRHAIGGIWQDLNPPFALGTPKVGHMVDVFQKNDYTKAKGWRLITAFFGNDANYPYFILYNKFRGVVRVFFYVGDNVPFSHAVATCSFHQNTPKTANLSLGGRTQIAADIYYHNPTIGDDIILEVIPSGAAVDHWASADFNMLLDPWIQEPEYDGANIVFKLYGVDNYAIQAQINGSWSTDPDQLKQHTIVSGKDDVESTIADKLNAANGHLIKKMESGVKIQTRLNDLFENVDTTKTPKFVDDLVGDYKDISESFTGFLKNIKKVSGAIAAVANVFEFFIGKSPSSDEVTMPEVTYASLALTGTMEIKKTLAATTLKLPGVTAQGVQTLPYYDCPLGLINLKKTPTVKRTHPYARIPCPGVAGTVYPSTVLEGYSGKYVKYVLDEDIEVVLQDIPGVKLLDVKYAFILKAPSDFPIEESIIATHQFAFYNGQTFQKSLVNPVYEQIEDGIFALHKYTSDEKLFGTPYLNGGCFQGVRFEVPEHTEVRLGVIALIDDGVSDEPILFSAKYAVLVSEVVTPINASRCGSYRYLDQETWPYSDYYDLSLAGGVVLNQQNTTGVYESNYILLNPGFSGVPNFVANPKPPQKCLGEAASLTKVDLGCSEYAKIAFNEPQTSHRPSLKELQVYPNPAIRYFTLSASSVDESLGNYQLFNSLGVLIKEGLVDGHDVSIDISGFDPGVYFVKAEVGGEIKSASVYLE